WFPLRWSLQLLWRQASIAVQLATAALARLAAAAILAPLARVGQALLWAADRFLAGYARFAEVYRRLLAGSLARGGAVLVVAATLFALSMPALRWLGAELLPEVHQG